MLRESGTPISTARLSKPAFGWVFWQGRYSPARHPVISVYRSWFPHPSLSSRSALSIVAKRRLHQRKRVDRQLNPQPDGYILLPTSEGGPNAAPLTLRVRTLVWTRTTAIQSHRSFVPWFAVILVLLLFFFDVALSQNCRRACPEGTRCMGGGTCQPVPPRKPTPPPVRQRCRLSIGQLCGPCLLSRSAKI